MVKNSRLFLNSIVKTVRHGHVLICISISVLGNVSFCLFFLSSYILS